MTVSITPCWKRRLERCAVLLAGLLLLGLARAGGIEPRTAALLTDERGYALAAEFAIQLGPRLEQAVGLGVPLDFRLEFTLTRKRKYWIDEHIAGRVVNYRLNYHALTRQYRLSFGGLHQNFASLDEALQVLGRVVRLHVAAPEALTSGETYSAAVRLSLDHSQLPKPLQVDALADREWRIEAQTLRWEFTPAAPDK
ncbi:MAG: DUF4390 domain-containing protein [Pseudomonadota bacterium]